MIREFIHTNAAAMWQIDPGRLAAAMKRADLNQSQLAEAVGVKQPSIARLLKGETKTSRALDQIARVLETSPAYLKGESESPEVPEIAAAAASQDVPQLALSALAWPVDLTSQEPAACIPFPREWLRTMGVEDVGGLFVARAEGDQMMPTLLAGDLALIDMAQAYLVDQDRLFAIQYADLMMLRRLRRLADGSLRIFADNPQIEPIQADPDDVGIVGRVVWIGRQV